MPYTPVEAIFLVTCVPFGLLMGFLGAKWYRYANLKNLVRRMVQEHRAEREKIEVECLHCLFGKVWKPDIVKGKIDISDVDQVLFDDCKKCGGQGFVLR